MQRETRHVTRCLCATSRLEPATLTRSTFVARGSRFDVRMTHDHGSRAGVEGVSPRRKRKAAVRARSLLLLPPPLLRAM